jgi:RHS repeat-associated protein
VKGTVKDLSGKPLSEQFSKSFLYTGADLLIFQKPDPNQRKESYVGNTTLFQGREYDPETGLYYFRARYYHPELGRFLSSDPNGYEDSLNPNQSFLNNPINFTDPYGAQVVEVTPKGARFKAERGLTFEEGYLMWISAEGLSREEVVSGKISGSRRRGILRRMGLSSEEIMEVERRVGRQELTVEFVDRPGGKPLILDEKAKNPTKVYNAIAKVVLNRDIRLGEFDAYTLPSDQNKFATVAGGTYIGKPHPHKGKPAIQLGISEKKRKIPTKGINPAYPNQIYRLIPSSLQSIGLEGYFIQGYATGINIHMAASQDRTLMFISSTTGKPVHPSQGCLLIRTSQWDEFSEVVNMVYGIGRARINVSTSGNLYIPEIHSPFILIAR